MSIYLVDCTLRDGGYYNAWDFAPDVVRHYLEAMHAAGVDYAELGFRSFDSKGFKGAAAYSSDSWIRSLGVPAGLKAGVMVNASEVVKHPAGVVGALKLLFTPSAESPVSLVRLACHIHEFADALPGCAWLQEQGYTVGINLMQIADRTAGEIEELSRIASTYSLDALYFADSLGSMDPEQTAQVVSLLRTHWKGALGIHTHDNMGQALANTMRALKEGVTWVDSTVTGMGRGPGNVKTEYVAIELQGLRKQPSNITPLLSLVSKYFVPMQKTCGWGSNPYYYLAGKHGIHPTYIQEMLSDSRYGDEDVLAVIEHLKSVGGKKFSLSTLEAARHFYSGPPRGMWSPSVMMSGREVLILGTGPGIDAHRTAIEEYIVKHKPFVLALNTQTSIEASLIDVRAACHPVRLLADCVTHLALPQPLITPASMLPESVREALGGKTLLDFGLAVEPDTFEFNTDYCVLPTSLVIAYSLAIATSGRARNILLAGFDGYAADDPRNREMDKLVKLYASSEGALSLAAITPTKYAVESRSIYAMVQ